MHAAKPRFDIAYLFTSDPSIAAGNASFAGHLGLFDSGTNEPVSS